MQCVLQERGRVEDIGNANNNLKSMMRMKHFGKLEILQ